MIVWIDESGNHNLDLDRSDGIYDWFVLGAVIFSLEAYKIFDTQFRALKKNHFGTEDFVLHTAEMTRPNKARSPLNLKFNKPKFREAFYADMKCLIEKTDFEAVFCAINKQKFVDVYGKESAADPYHFSLENVLNRILKQTLTDRVSIFPEKRDFKADRLLEIEILRLKTQGTKFYEPQQLDRRIRSFSLCDKQDNDSGLQLIDLLVTPVGRFCNGKKPKPSGNEIPYAVVKPKIPNGCLTVFP